MARTNRKELVALVVDDSASMRQYLIAVLQQNGVDRVYESPDGAAALRLMRDAQPQINILFCDLEMPQMDGVDAVPAGAGSVDQHPASRQGQERARAG